MGILNRSHVKHLLLAYLHGELSPAERDRVAQHIRHCEACRQALAEEERLAAELRTRLPILAAPQPGQLARLWTGIAARIAPQEASRRVSRRGPATALSSAFGMALTFGLIFAIALPLLLGGDMPSGVATQPRPDTVNVASFSLTGTAVPGTSDTRAPVTGATVTATAPPTATETPVPTPAVGA